MKILDATVDRKDEYQEIRVQFDFYSPSSSSIFPQTTVEALYRYCDLKILRDNLQSTLEKVELAIKELR